MGLSGYKRGYGRIKGDMGEELEGWGDAKRKVFTLILVKIGANGAKKKPLGSGLNKIQSVIITYIGR